MQKTITPFHSILYGILLGIFFVTITVFCIPLLLMVIVDYFNVNSAAFSFDALIKIFFRIAVIAMILPAVFCVALVPQFSFKLRWQRMWEMTAFSFMFLSLLLISYFLFMVSEANGVNTLMKFLLILNKPLPLILCVLVSVSIERCFAYGDLPLPAKDYILASASFGETSSGETSFDKNQKYNDIKNIWAEHVQRCPKAVRRGLLFGYSSTIFLLIGTFASLLGLPASNYASGMFFWNIFLFGLILYYIGKKPYAFWRYAYILLVITFFVMYIGFEEPFWQILLVISLIGHLTAIFFFFRQDARQWFV